MPTIKKIFLKKISSVLGLFIVCGFSLTLGAILLRVAYSAFTQPTLPPTDANQELGFLASLIGKATDIAGTNTLFGRLGKVDDVPSINTSLFAGQQAIYDLVNTKCGGGGAPDPASCIKNLTATSYGYKPIAIGIDGFPIISYQNTATQDLEVIHCSTRNCSVWNPPVVLDSAGNVGVTSSITIGSDNNPIISYWDATDKNMQVIHCTDIDCSTFGAPVIFDSGSGGAYTSITIGIDGFPVISYYADIITELRIVHCGSINCSVRDVLKTLDSGGMYNSITIGVDNNPIISYWDQANKDLKIVHCISQNCNTNDAPRTLDSIGDVGEYSSIAISPVGYPIISYYDATNADLKVAYCTSVDCSNNETRVLDSTGIVGLYTSITIGSDNFPIIFYSGWTLGLKIIHCNTGNCSGADSPIFVDNSNNTTYTAITVGADGYPVMTYRDNNLGQRVIKCDDVKCNSCSL